MPLTVTVGDQFAAIALTLRKPQLLCAPTNKNGEDDTAPFHPDHLLCYKAKSPRRSARSTSRSRNQFGPDQARLIHRRELWVPSFKNPPTTTTTTTTPTTSTSTVTNASTTSTVTPTTNAPTTTTLVYGSPSGAFLAAVPGGLLD